MHNGERKIDSAGLRSRESPGSCDASSPAWWQWWLLPAWGTAGRIPTDGRSSVSIVRASNQLALSKLPRAAVLTIGLATLINLGLFFVFTAAGLITESVLIPSPSGTRPVIAVDVVTATVLFMLVGVLVFAAIIRSAALVSSAPGRWWRPSCSCSRSPRRSAASLARRSGMSLRSCRCTLSPACSRSGCCRP
jgi:hypothetical protein